MGAPFYVRHLFWGANRCFRIIFELIKGEMAYVRDLENIETVCFLYSLAVFPRNSDVHHLSIRCTSALSAMPNPQLSHQTGWISS